jgi:hypothetical protein
MHLHVVDLQEDTTKFKEAKVDAEIRIYDAERRDIERTRQATSRLQRNLEETQSNLECRELALTSADTDIVEDQKVLDHYQEKLDIQHGEQDQRETALEVREADIEKQRNTLLSQWQGFGCQRDVPRKQEESFEHRLENAGGDLRGENQEQRGRVLRSFFLQLTDKHSPAHIPQAVANHILSPELGEFDGMSRIQDLLHHNVVQLIFQFWLSSSTDSVIVGGESPLGKDVLQNHAEPDRISGGADEC